MGDEGLIAITLIGDESKRDLAAMLGDRPAGEILKVRVRNSTEPHTLSSLSKLAEEKGLSLRFEQLGE